MSDDLLSLVQKWMNKVPTIILGSGASVPYKIPGMFDLGTYIKENCKFKDKSDIAAFEAFVKRFNDTGDLESSLLEVKVTKSVLDSIISNTWKCINDADLDAYEKILTSEYQLPLKHLLEYW